MSKKPAAEIQLAGIAVPRDWALKLYPTASLYCQARILMSRGSLPEIFTFTRAVAEAKGEHRDFASREECRLYIAGVYLGTPDGRRKFAAQFPYAESVMAERGVMKRPVLRAVATKPSAQPFAATDAFLQSYQWRKARMQALIEHGARCQCCGASPATGAVMNVDHIKPRKTHPELALELSNLQVLCSECNHGKGNWSVRDWRHG